ncbi:MULTISPECIES: carboxypeptidase regulatory-like domain-containing protein [unclassified Schlesneria]|uniref:carboxypeptidase regulatory-like domain-containing protein n=1 Tax=unclassified Schlesneria TaxID=2762017 RepID=UPI002F164995
MKRALSHLFLFGLILMGLNGCGKSGPPKYPVSGSVTFKGTPVTEGMITFYRQDGGGIVAYIDGSGNFIMDKGLIEGQYRVYVEPPPSVLTPPPPGGPPKTPPKTYPNFPVKYRQAATSGLLATVEPTRSGNTFKFDMQP